MKKLTALILSIILVCCFSVTAFAAESPTATEKVTVTVRKADNVVFDAETYNFEGKIDVEYTIDGDTVIKVKSEDEYGTFNSWTIYKVVASVDGTVGSANNSGIITLSAVKNLAATTKVVEAVEGTDYEIISGSLNSETLSIKAKTSLIVCANYNNVKTEPLSLSNADNSSSAPQTGDLTVVYAAVVMLAALAFGFGVKKIYSK